MLSNAFSLSQLSCLCRSNQFLPPKVKQNLKCKHLNIYGNSSSSEKYSHTQKKPNKRQFEICRARRHLRRTLEWKTLSTRLGVEQKCNLMHDHAHKVDKDCQFCGTQWSFQFEGHLRANSNKVQNLSETVDSTNLTSMATMSTTLFQQSEQLKKTTRCLLHTISFRLQYKTWDIRLESAILFEERQ